jgi:hypothetical protein
MEGLVLEYQEDLATNTSISRIAKLRALHAISLASHTIP